MKIVNLTCMKTLILKAFTLGPVLLLLSLTLFTRAFAGEVKEKRNVLIINSYHQGFKWSRDITDGIIETLKQSGSFNISPFVEYMDWKNYPTDDNLQFLQNYYSYKYQGKDIDVIIAVDDAALEFVLKHRNTIFSNTPVVFCGINQKGVAEITAGFSNLTGVLEEIDPTETIKMALTINPDIKDVYVLFDNSESGLSSGEIVVNRIMEMNIRLNTIPMNNLSYDELIKEVESCDKNSIVLVTTYYSDGEGTIVEFENVSREISSHSGVPVYHLYDLGLNNGAFGGVMTGGKINGESAADLAIRILNGENPDDIPVLPPDTIRRVVDFHQLNRFGIPIDKILKGTEIINKPFSFFETYKTLVLGVIAVFTILLSFVLILLFYIAKIRKMKKHLSESHEELSQIYEELAASEEELKCKFDEIVSSNEKIRLSEEKLAYLAYHDVLTGLPNKLSLYEKKLLPEKGNTALMFIDLDHFKYINDTMGHAFGDQLIVKASQRLTSLIKDNCFVFRLGGDEFVMIVEGIGGKAAAEEFASGILEGFEEEFEVLNSMLHIGLSIGVVLYPEHGRSIEELVKYADIAMYKAKETGRKSCVLYDSLMNEAFAERVNIEKYLHTALVNNEFEIYYQPQLDLRSGGITGLEALLRWKSPQLGFVTPLKFIKVAEDTRLIIPLGAWVLKNACRFLKMLHNKGHINLSVSVNISMLQLMQNNFCEMVIDILKHHELEPYYLELEITESILMESFEAIGARLEELNRYGVRIALDDFGKGYSSLNYLKQLPVSTLKVDKSFIDNIANENDGNSLARHIVKIGKSLGMCVVAEGVERMEQLKYLAAYECDRIQGYLYSKPISEKELIKLLEIIQPIYSE